MPARSKPVDWSAAVARDGAPPWIETRKSTLQVLERLAHEGDGEAQRADDEELRATEQGNRGGKGETARARRRRSGGGGRRLERPAPDQEAAENANHDQRGGGNPMTARHPPPEVTTWRAKRVAITPPAT